MKVFQLNTFDYRGGAAQVAYNLKLGLTKRGHIVSFFVGCRETEDSDVYLVNPRRKLEFLSKLSKKIIGKDAPSFIRFKIRDLARALLADDITYFKNDFFLASERFINSDIVHCHNLHGDYLNLDILEKISRSKPIVWTLHDMWSFTGHCSYAFDCNKWKTGCGQCPSLNTYPSLLWDNTKKLWQKKREIYHRSNLYIVVPSFWLKKKVEKSMLKEFNITLIYNGININKFKKYNKLAAREELKLPLNKKIVMFLADSGAGNARKGWSYAQQIVNYYNDVLFLCIGNKTNKRIKKGNVYYIGFIKSHQLLAKYFSASDIFLFTSSAENFPLVILEAMACGAPIVSFDVGGVKEAVIHKENGYIAKYKDIDDFKNGINYLLNLSDGDIKNMADSSRKRVEKNFSLEIMVNNYLKLYEDILNNWQNNE